MNSLRERILGWPRVVRTAMWVLLLPMRLALWLLDVLLTAPGIALLLLALAVVGGVIGYRSQHGAELRFEFFLRDFYANLSTELVSIGITVLVIDGLSGARQSQADKSSLLIRMRSKRNETAVDAVEEARSRGWLQKGLVKGADLRGANLKRADFRNGPLTGANLSYATLKGADFRGADLTKVNIEKAILVGANLKGATVTDEQLSLAYILTYAVMPDGSFYNGRFNLEGDLRGALQSNINIHSARAMADYYSIRAEASADPITLARMEYYDVSTDEYRRGQQWALGNLANVRGEGLRRLKAWGFEPSQEDRQSRVVVFDLDEVEPDVRSDSASRTQRRRGPLRRARHSSAGLGRKAGASTNRARDEAGHRGEATKRRRGHDKR